MPAMSLTFGVGRASFGGASASGGDKLPSDLKQKVFERDNHDCAFCGFHAEKYQDVHFVNGDSNDTAMANLTTACMFCAQCFHLDHVGAIRSGVLIWLPEIPQTALNHIARAIYVARISQGPMMEAARKALDALMKRREEARSRLGTDDPFILASVLQDYISGPAYERRAEKLEGIRLLPLDRRIVKEGDMEFNQFPQILAYWRSKDGPFGGRVPNRWAEFYKQIPVSDAA
ncbi:MAG: type IVB secretion system protein IcmJDotN [Alphaproteobacteria bacterium]|nr:type IVB secretion system protein IcmJDotN [Alphaproteobacteria bacterium]